MLGDRLLICGFLALLVLPIMDRCARPGQIEHVRAELRNPAAWPGWPQDWEAGRVFPERVERWHSDSVGLRDHWVRWHNQQLWSWWSKAPGPQHTLGEAGFVYLAADQAREVWRGQRALSESELEAWCQAIRERRERFAQEQIPFWFVVAPNKETIYPEYLPESERSTRPTPLVQLDAALRQRGEPAWFDARPTLLAEKRFDRPEADDWTYLRLGSHYSYRGGAALSLALAEQGRSLGLDFPRIPREDWEVRMADAHNIEDSIPLSWHLSQIDREPLYRCFPRAGRQARLSMSSSEAFPFRQRYQGPSAAPRVVLIHDSFGHWTRPSLAELCSELETRWQYFLPVQELIDSKPDLVIQLITERHLLESPEPLELSTQRVDPQQWASAEPREPHSRWIERVRPHGNTQFEALANGLALNCAVGQDKFYYALAPWPSSATMALRVELFAERDSALYVWFGTQADPRIRPLRRVRVSYAAGLQQLCFTLPTTQPAGELLIQPLDGAGRVELRAIEVRALREGER